MTLTHNLLAMAALLAALAILLVVLKAAENRGRLHPESLRKGVHVGMGLVVLPLPWVFDRAWPVVVLAVLAFRRFGRGHPVRLAALASVLFTVTESLFGAVLVVFGWVAEDVSTGRVLIRPFHVTNTFLLMGALGLTAWWTSRGVARITWPGNPQSRRFLAAAAGLLALAATGSWTGLAGTAFPAASIAAGLAQYLDPGHLLIYLRMAHPVVAVLALVLLVRATGMPTGLGAEGVRRPLTRLVWVLGAAQPAVGTLTVLLLHPTGLRLLHLALADFLWLATLFLWSTHLEGGAEEPERETAALGRASRTE